MKILTGILAITRNFNESKLWLFNYTVQRGLKFATKLKWVRPEKVNCWNPSYTGDLSAIQYPSEDELKLLFRNSKELSTCNDNVKKVFSLSYQYPWFLFRAYEAKLIESVRRNKYDTTSPEVIIAKLTAKIRYYQPILNKLPVNGRIAAKMTELVDKRKKKLTELRKNDYKRFEWILEKLNLVYKPNLNYHAQVTRKSSLRILAKLKVEQEKEAKLAECREEFDKQKVPFLEKKLEKLKWIKEMEEKYGFPPTITEKEIEECKDKLEKTKIQVEENMKYGYKLKVHPFTLEKYHEARLVEKESA